jgi:hypothetical protein
MMRRQTSLLVAAGILASALFALPAARGDEPKEVLKLKLPKPQFVGTPQNIKSANLEAPRKGKRPDVSIPKGCTNVAFEKEVTGSDEAPIVGELEQVTDGDKEAPDGSYVEMAPGKQYVQIDLEKSYTIYAIALWHFHQQARAYHDVVIQTASDPDFIMDVKTVFNNDHDNSSGLGVGKDKEYIETFEGRVIPVDGVKARYIRFWSNGSTSNEMNHYIEAEVYGK